MNLWTDEDEQKVMVSANYRGGLQKLQIPSFSSGKAWAKFCSVYFKRAVYRYYHRKIVMAAVCCHDNTVMEIIININDINEDTENTRN